jgi:L-ascorbate metabolism protein UlaG (beta-lactamase superfamily)
MHANAVKNPKMLGGPFMDLPGNQTATVKALMEKTLAENADLLAVADAIKALDEILANEARGHSLLPLYDKIPDPLKGYVELTYDLNNHPSARYIERMLYRSKYYDTGRQSIRLATLDKDDRAFCLSTPRFPDAKHLHYDIPFASEAIDRLFRMKFEAGSFDDIPEFIPEDAEQRAFFESLFTEEEPEIKGEDKDSLGADGVRVKYFGHATLLFETANVSVMTDPLVSYDVPGADVPRYSFRDLPRKIDYAVITHGHQDHIMWETLLQLRHRIGCIVVPRCNGDSLQDPSLRLMLENTGFNNVVELAELEDLEIPDGRITGLPFFGEHGELNIRGKLAYRVELNGKSAICAADSNNLSPVMYDMLFDAYGKADKTFIGMECEGAPMSWLYGPLLTKPLERRMDQSRRLDGSDAEKAMRMIESLKSDEIYIYAMGQEPWLTFISSIKYSPTSKPIVESNKVLESCKEKGFTAERLFGRKAMGF